MMDEYTNVTDKAVCILLACHSVAYEVFQFRQQALLLAHGPTQPRRDRWLGHLSRQKEIFEDLSTMHTYCEMQSDPAPEALFTLEYLMMALYVSLDDIQLFSGRSGEEEARRVYPRIRDWTQDVESRTTIWHAGQVLRLARNFEKTRLRDFYAVAVYHATLTLWVFGMVTSNTARRSRAQTPVGPRGAVSDLNGIGNREQSQPVLLDGEDDKAAKGFRHLGHGKPCLWNNGQNIHGFVSKICFLENSQGVMLLAAELLKSNYPRSHSGLPPLVENLASLMIELSNLSGRVTS